MAKNFFQWVEDTKNKYWDMDGAYGAQCWDLWAKYSMEQWGMALQDCITPTQYAGGLTSRYPTNPRQGEIYELKDNTYTPQAGDVAVWQVCASYPTTHVAIVVDGIQGNTIHCITQNPEPSVVKNIPLEKQSISYLHPKAYGTGGADGNNKPTGGTSPSGSTTTGSSQTGVSKTQNAWIQLHGDNLYLHESNTSGTTQTRIFYKSTAQNWVESTSKTASSAGNTNQGTGGMTPPTIGDATGDAETNFALYVIGTIETGLRWGITETTGQGIGIVQWSFGRRIDVLQSMKKTDPEGYAKFKTQAPNIAALVDANDRNFTRLLTAAEQTAFADWNTRAQAHEGQRAQFVADWKSYPKPCGNTKCNILYNCAYHQSPAAAQQLSLSDNLATLKNNILGYPTFSPYTNRYNTAYNLLNAWDGQRQPPNF